MTAGMLKLPAHRRGTAGTRGINPLPRKNSAAIINSMQYCDRICGYRFCVKAASRVEKTLKYGTAAGLSKRAARRLFSFH